MIAALPLGARYSPSLLEPDLADLEGPPIVAIGASAGGVEALQSVLQALVTGAGLAYVVIQHRAPGHSQLVEVLARSCALPVAPAVHGERPAHDHVYVARPEDMLTIEQGTFLVRPVHKQEMLAQTVDTFFESLAAAQGRRAIAVVLSGTGRDGTAGAICIKQAGGTVLVQAPATAAQDGMPASVIARQAFDYVLPPAELARRLPHCGVAPAPAGETIARLDEIIGLIRAHAAIDLRGYKTMPLIWRVQQRMDVRRSGSFADYVALLRDDPAELEAVIRGIPIHVTEFFRDPEVWDALSREALAPLVARGGPGALIRAWTPACATGEEAYSLAMLLAEHTAPTRLDFQIFATDVAPAVLARASAGAFSADAVLPVSPERRARFLYAADGGYRVRRSLREKMVFASQNLLSDPPFSHLDLITCRNLLIYLDTDARDRVLFLLHSALRPGGYLLLGKSEPLLWQEGFEPVSDRWHLYRKTGTRPARDIKFPTRARATAEPAPEAEAIPEGTPAGQDAARSSREELEASREELQAVNEELRAANDQLNTANDNLSWLNARLGAKVAELELQNRVLSAGGVTTLLLDQELRLRWFTPAVTQLFPVLVHDTGRRITDLVKSFEDAAFVDDVLAVLGAGEPRETEVRDARGRWLLRRISPSRLADDTPGAAVTFTDITALRRAETELRRSDALQRGPNEALEAAVDGAPLEAALGLLVRASLDHFEDGVRCAFYLVNAEGTELRHVIGMPDAYSRCIGGIRIGPDSLACGLAAYTAQPVLTADIREEPRWRKWLAVGEDFGYRACWSIPLATVTGKVVGTLAIYHPEPRAATARDLALVDGLARSAALIIARHHARREP